MGIINERSIGLRPANLNSRVTQIGFDAREGVDVFLRKPADCRLRAIRYFFVTLIFR